VKLWSIVILFFIFLGTLFTPICPENEVEERVAFVIIPKLNNTNETFFLEINNYGIAILEALDYRVIPVRQKSDLQPVNSIRTVVLYMGHGSNGTYRHALFAVHGNIYLQEIIRMITTQYLFMFVGACYGGSWLEYAAPNRMIISATNNTVGVAIGEFKDGLDLFWQPNLTEFLSLCLQYSVEESFKRFWHMMKFLTTEIIQELDRYEENRPLEVSLPVMYDGIEGDIYL
jgi:hypothetical protein